ncbi:MAG: hypothetical protein WCF30_01815 [Terracidiphilus sp.]
MSYDRIWIESTEHRRGLLERHEAAKKNRGDEFYANFDRLYAQGDFVVLSAGKNCIFEEIVLFEDGISAQEFYERGFQKWERFPDDDEEEGFGFQEVSLYQAGCMVASKSCAPSAPTELNRAEGNEWWEKVGKQACDLADEER